MSGVERPEAFSPDAGLCEVAGVPIVLEAVVLRAWGVLLFVGVRRNIVTDRLHAEWRTAFDEWEKHVRRARERGAEPPAGYPEEPGSAIFGSLPIIISDDLDTVYRWVGKSAGGSGTEWDALWQFRPAVPLQARSLTVSIDSAHSAAIIEAIAPIALSLR